MKKVFTLRPKAYNPFVSIPGKRLLSLSGGSTKFISLVGRSRAIIESGFDPDVICGLSSGAIACLPIAMKMWDVAIDKGLNLSLKDFWKKVPINEKTNKVKLTSVIRLLRKGHLGIQDVGKILRSVISEETFDKYKKDLTYPECYILAIQLDTRERTFWRVRSLSYKQYIDVVEASSAIPVFAQEKEINGEVYADGGLRDHNCGAMIAECMKDLEEHHSIYTRPQNIDDTHPTKWPKKKVVLKIQDMFSMMSDEISRSDARHELDYANLNNVKLSQHFMPKILTSLYDTNKERLRLLYLESKKLNRYCSTNFKKDQSV